VDRATSLNNRSVESAAGNRVVYRADAVSWVELLSAVTPGVQCGPESFVSDSARCQHSGEFRGASRVIWLLPQLDELRTTTVMCRRAVHRAMNQGDQATPCLVAHGAAEAADDGEE
jgi:hypothetical protein